MTGSKLVGLGKFILPVVRRNHSVLLGTCFLTILFFLSILKMLFVHFPSSSWQIKKQSTTALTFDSWLYSYVWFFTLRQNVYHCFKHARSFLFLIYDIIRDHEKGKKGDGAGVAQKYVNSSNPLAGETSASTINWKKSPRVQCLSSLESNEGVLHFEFEMMMDNREKAGFNISRKMIQKIVKKWS